MKVAVVVFPGSNCDHDALHAFEGLLGQKAFPVWHKDTSLNGADIVVLPGGFAYGDYLRTGALAKLSPIMKEVRDFAEKGGPTIGICNGFQILCEAGLLPGVLLQNAHIKFLSQFVNVKVERNDTPFSRAFKAGDVITCPIAHMEGNYFADEQTIKRLEGEGQVVFRYCSNKGEVNPSNTEWNPNGAMLAIAGICNSRRNVVGLMPHPERAAEKIVGFVGRDTGLGVIASAINP